MKFEPEVMYSKVEILIPSFELQGEVDAVDVCVDLSMKVMLKELENENLENMHLLWQVN
jgi:hypothetical protein